MHATLSISICLMHEVQDTMWLEMEPEVEAGASTQEDLYIWLGNLIVGLLGIH